MKRTWFLILLLTVACGRRKVENIVIKGSDTEVNVVLEAAESFMERDSSVSVTITGGGSGVGITALFNGKCDIALSSRPLSSYEEAIAMRKGVKIVPTVFATDAVVIITHPSINIKQLSVEQVGKIYSGEITNWNQVGGKSGTISLYGRQSNSGTYSYFRENIVKADFSKDVKEMNGTAQIVEGVKQDPNSIGYVGLGYIIDQNGRLYDGLNALALRFNDSTVAVSPLNKGDVKAGKYPLTRPLYEFTVGEPTGKIKEFIDFELSAEGQRIIESNGFLPVIETYILAIDEKAIIER